MVRRTLLLLAPMLVLVAATVAGQDLEELLTQVGEPYAEAYSEPLIHAFGANQNTGLYHTAHIPAGKLTFSIGVKVMGTYLNESDQSFQKVIENVDLGDYLPEGHPNAGDTGDIVLAGPTVFGSTEEVGTGTAYVNGVPVYQVEGIPGLLDTRWVPLFAPEMQVGGLFGLKGSIRWLPELNLSDYGKTKYLGLGIQWSPNFLLSPTFPVDLMVGYFGQEVELGTFIQTDASSVYAAASKRFGIADVYGGLAWESSTMKVDYTQIDTDVPVSFEKDGRMTNRVTIGATLNLGVMINAEMGIGKMVVYNLGLMFGM